MNDQLLDYLLDRLDGPAKRQVEARLQVDTGARRQLDLLRQALAPLAADQEIVPPPHLAVRTIARIAEHVCRELPRAPVPRHSESAGRPWWRRADVVAAACLLAMFVGLGLPVLVKMRGPGSDHALEACRNNLREFHVALKTYQDQHKQLPPIDKAPGIAGMIVPALIDAGTLNSASFNINCPGHGPFQACSSTLEQLRTMSPDQLAKHAPHLLLSYAYTLGCRDEDGGWHPISRSEDTADHAVLIFADGPPPNVAAGNSLNHGGKGQNILFLDGHVQFVTLRSLAGDDIYLNRANRVAAGLDNRDFVLGAAAAKP